MLWRLNDRIEERIRQIYSKRQKPHPHSQQNTFNQ